MPESTPAESARSSSPSGTTSTIWSALLIATMSLALSLILSFGTAWPVPTILDEFSYLLSGDTFAHGRLSNPSHPLWHYFESPHTIQQPSYASKFPPGHGLFLALGAIMGHPLVGAWIEAAGAALAVYYLLRAILPERWALLGGILAVFHPLQLMWSQSYWGGSLQAAGGALLVGAAIRGWKNPRWIYGVVMGAGVSILALSRPFEGAVFSVLCAVPFTIALLRRGFGTALRQAGVLAIGFVPVLAAAAVFLMANNKATTGDATLMPYVVHGKKYGGSPVFLWQTPGPFPEYPTEIWRKEAEWERTSFMKQKTGHGFWSFLFGVKLLPVSYQCTWYWLLLLPLAAAAIGARKQPYILVIFALLAFFLIFESQIPWWFPHYFAAAFGLVLLLSIEGLRRIQMASPARGTQLVALLVVLLIGVSLLFQFSSQLASRDGYHWEVERQKLVEKLQARPGKHLVIVSYAPDNSPHAQWVYNGADIDGSKVVFAQSLPDMAPLLEYFRDRTIWRVHVTPEKFALAQLARRSQPQTSE